MQSVEARLSRIEASLKASLEAAERRARRWRAAALLLAGAGVLGAAGAFTASPPLARAWSAGALGAAPVSAIGHVPEALTADVIRTRRLEVVRDDGKVVLLAFESEGGGQLDLWNASGANTARLASPEEGGDLVLFNSKGQMVVGAYAADQGGRIEAFHADGSLGIRAGVADGGAALSVGGPLGKEVVYLGNDRGGAGSLRLADRSGQTAATVMAGAGGGVFEASTREGTAAALIGAAANGRSGVIQLSAQGAKPVYEVDVRDDGAARVLLGTAAGTTNLVLEAGVQDSGLLSCFTGGRRVLAVGAGQYGGQINLFGLDGNPVIVMGPVADGQGGAVSVRGAEGRQVLRAGVDPSGAGEVSIYSGNGQKKRVISAE